MPDALDPQQRAAVDAGPGPVLVVAGPGSGKTRVLCARLRRVLAEGTPPQRVLCMTFTRRAAAQMAERAGVRADRRRDQAWVATFHSVCLRILRAEAEHIAPLRRSFSIYGGAAQARVVRKAMKSLGLDTREHPVSQVLDRIQAVRRSASAGPERFSGVYGPALRLYEEAIAKANATDFNGLILECVRLFSGNPEARARWSNRFDHVLVDEFQDTNPLQLAFLRTLVEGQSQLFAVGDPDQSIYGWRGADPTVMLEFAESFGESTILRLEHNYRSSANILEAADALIEHNQERLPKRLIATKESGDSILSLALKDTHHEARALGKVIQNLVTDGAPYGDIAVLYRAHHQQRAIESLFARWKIPFHVAHGTAFLERREIQDVIAYLRVIDNPRDEDAFWRAIQSPKRGIGEISQKRLQGIVDEANRDVFWREQVALGDAIQSTRVTRQFKGRTREGLETFAELLDRFRALSAQPAYVAIEAIQEELEPLGWIEALAGGEGTGDRRSALEELVHAAREFHERYPDDGISGFLSDVALVTDLDADDDENAAPKDAVQLMTLHASKGQEFPIVFVTGLEEELLPHQASLESAEDGTSDEEGVGVEEERRLFFVGMTRAKSQLFLTRARKRSMYGSVRPSRTSRFYHELPGELVEPLDPDQLDVLAITEEAPAGAGFRVGERVSHRHYGDGVVGAFLGRDLDARIIVDFDAFGVKELFLAHTSLRKLRS